MFECVCEFVCESVSHGHRLAEIFDSTFHSRRSEIFLHFLVLAAAVLKVPETHSRS